MTVIFHIRAGQRFGGVQASEARSHNHYPVCTLAVHCVTL